MGDDGGISRRALLTGGAAFGALLAAGGVGAAVEWDNPTFVRLRGGCGSTPPLPHSSYAVTSGSLDSAAMRATLPWSVALPPGHGAGDGTPLLLCLPGRDSGPEAVLHAEGVPAWASAGGYRFAVAAPGGGAATYWHPRRTGIDPLRYLVDEFIPMVEQRFDVGGDRQHRAAIGWSMGGFGVLLLAQQQPALLGAVAAMSPAVFSSYSGALSGHPDTFDSAADWQRYGLWDHLADLRGTPVRIDCGGADPFAPTARTLLRRVPGAVGGIGSGCHDNSFWRRTTPKALRFLASHVSGAT